MSIFKRTRKVKGAFENLLSPELIDQLAAEAKANPNREFLAEMKHFQYVVIHMDETDPAKVPGITTRSISSFLENGAWSQMLSSISVCYLGVHDTAKDSRELRVNLVSLLLQNCGGSIRIAHGECDGLVGNFGKPGGWHYGAIIPNFSYVLSKLLNAEFGTATEIT